VRVYLFDPAAAEGLPSLPAVGIPAGMPFVLDHDATPVAHLNRWLRSLPTTGVPAPRSWAAYANDLVAWRRFLHQRGMELIADVAGLRDAVAAYHADRRMGELSRRRPLQLEPGRGRHRPLLRVGQLRRARGRGLTPGAAPLGLELRQVGCWTPRFRTPRFRT
jgi:hypothetical protein